MNYSPDMYRVSRFNDKIKIAKNGFVAAFTICLLIQYCPAAFAQEGGYVSSLSVTKGDTEDFFISSSYDSIEVIIFRLGSQKKQVQALHISNCGIQSTQDSAYTKGAGWHITASLNIPLSWVPGVYEADFPTSAGTKQIVFVVKERSLGSFSKAVVCLTVNTYEAYNNWGGKSLYGYNSTDKLGVGKVSFNRPFSDDATVGYFQWSDKLVKWLSNEHLNVEYCTNLDLDRDPSFLSHYDVYVTAGHDEYWSRPERNSCQDFINRGGRMVILSGNTCWWQVRIEDDGHSLICYKDYKKDPFYPTQDSIVTCNWRRFPVNDSENSFTGVSYEHGGYVNSGTVMPKSKGYGGYCAFNTHHWIYNETETKDGDIIGFDASVVGYETDGAIFNWMSGTPMVTGKGGTPMNYSILGLSPAKPDGSATGVILGHATMGYYTNPSGGAVFNASTTNWVSGLVTTPDSAIIIITRNVLQRFLNQISLPLEIYAYSPVQVTPDSISKQYVQIGCRALPMNFQSTDTFVVHARDPIGKKLEYIWNIGEDIVSQDSVFVISAADKKCFPNGVTIISHVTNGTDTASLEWTLQTTNIHFVSTPPVAGLRRHSNFRYKPQAHSLKKGSLQYDLIQAPGCLHLNSKGIITGRADTSAGTYPVSILATDTQGNTALQTFNIMVQDSLAPTARNMSYFIRSDAFPNPFSGATRIEFDLQNDTPVTIEILDLRGIRRCSLLKKTVMIRGKHFVFWDGIDESGKTLSSGTYYCRIATENMGTVVLKLIKI